MEETETSSLYWQKLIIKIPKEIKTVNASLLCH
jgi:hypothetical protein